MTLQFKIPLKMSKILRFIFFKLLKFIEIILILCYLIIEEVLWVRIGLPIYRQLHKIQLLQHFEEYAEKKMNPWLLFILFLVPFVLMEIIGLISGKMFISGHFIWGILLYIGKGLFTPLVVFIFNAGKSKLLTFKIVKWSYHFILWLQQTVLYQSIIEKIGKLKIRIKCYFKSFKGEYSFIKRVKDKTKKTYHSLKKTLRRPL